MRALWGAPGEPISYEREHVRAHDIVMRRRRRRARVGPRSGSPAPDRARSAGLGASPTVRRITNRVIYGSCIAALASVVLAAWFLFRLPA